MNLGVLLVGVLLISALLHGVHIRVPDFWQLPFGHVPFFQFSIACG